MNDVVVHVCVKDRPSEIGLLLQSLRTQIYQKFNILVLDDGSEVPLTNYYFVSYLMNRIMMEGHSMKIIRNNIPSGVSKARQQLVDYTLKKGKEKYILRVDDDVVLERDYITKLFAVIKEGYDIASGITSPLAQPEWRRDTKYVKPIINECILDNEGNLIKNGDDCGWGYIQDEIIPSHHFRSCALIKRKVFESGVDYNSRLSNHGFREEQILSFKALVKGFKIGIRTSANALHLVAPSGGERPTTNLTDFNQQVFEETTKEIFKEHGNFIDTYNKKLKIKTVTPHPEELLKVTNLITRK